MYAPGELGEILARRLVPAPDPRELRVPGVRPAAVLVPLIAGEGEPRLVFTERTTTMSRHAGEISFPGGLPEAGEDLSATALREAEEEVGIVPARVTLVGTLPPVHTHVSAIIIVPFVGMLAKEPSFVPNEAEIATVMVFPLWALAEVGEERPFQRDGLRFTTHAFEIEGNLIWGATARIVRSLLDVLESTDTG